MQNPIKDLQQEQILQMINYAGNESCIEMKREMQLLFDLVCSSNEKSNLCETSGIGLNQFQLTNAEEVVKNLMPSGDGLKAACFALYMFVKTSEFEYLTPAETQMLIVLTKAILVAIDLRLGEQGR